MLANEQAELGRARRRKDEIKVKAEQDQKNYDDRNYRDEQFDLSDTFISVAVALLAVVSLVQKRWLFCFALIPELVGVVMGLAGLMGCHLHPDALITLLS